MIKLIPWFLLGCLIGALMYFMGRLGYEKGFAAATIECKTANIKTLIDTIESGQQLVTDANAASLALGKTINERITADQQTTAEIRRALTTTAHLRVDCVFDADVMRNITHAADRADKAATGGFSNTLRSGTEAE